jgi:hypothetical protein
MEALGATAETEEAEQSQNEKHDQYEDDDAEDTPPSQQLTSRQLIFGLVPLSPPLKQRGRRDTLSRGRISAQDRSTGSAIRPGGDRGELEGRVGRD